MSRILLWYRRINRRGVNRIALLAILTSIIYIFRLGHGSKVAHDAPDVYFRIRHPPYDALVNSRNPRFEYFDTAIDVRAIVTDYIMPNLKPTPGFGTNFLGVKVPHSVPPPHIKLEDMEDPPLIQNWHADLAEWGAILRSVDLARARGSTYTIMELGAGWGCWILNAGAAAKQKGLSIHTIAVEADRSMIKLMKYVQEINGRTPAELSVFHGAASAEDGLAVWPLKSAKDADNGAISYGLEGKYGLTKDEFTQLIDTGSYEALPMVSLRKAAGGERRIDLLHIDVQGAEVNVITAASMPYLKKNVAYIFVGGHSRLAEGIMHQRLAEAGWILEVDRAAIFAPGTTTILVDGAQGWRNPHLT